MQDTEYIPKVASHCCACGRTLKDATSIEFGIGPVCRKKYQYEDAYPIDEGTALQLAVFLTDSAIPAGLAGRIGEACLDDNSRRAANLLVHAASTEGPHAAIQAAQALRLLGYEKLASRMQQRLAKIHISVEYNHLIVQTPFNPAFLAAMRNIPHRKWDFTRKVNVVPSQYKTALFQALLYCFHGELGVGPKGPFIIERKAA
jgi:hypothetical protein